MFQPTGSGPHGSGRESGSSGSGLQACSHREFVSTFARPLTEACPHDVDGTGLVYFGPRCQQNSTRCGEFIDSVTDAALDCASRHAEGSLTFDELNATLQFVGESCNVSFADDGIDNPLPVSPWHHPDRFPMFNDLIGDHEGVDTHDLRAQREPFYCICQEDWFGHLCDTTLSPTLSPTKSPSAAPTELFGADSTSASASDEAGLAWLWVSVSLLIVVAAGLVARKLRKDWREAKSASIVSKARVGAGFANPIYAVPNEDGKATVVLAGAPAMQAAMLPAPVVDRAVGIENAIYAVPSENGGKTVFVASAPLVGGADPSDSAVDNEGAKLAGTATDKVRVGVVGFANSIYAVPGEDGGTAMVVAGAPANGMQVVGTDTSDSVVAYQDGDAEGLGELYETVVDGSGDDYLEVVGELSASTQGTANPVIDVPFHYVPIVSLSEVPHVPIVNEGAGTASVVDAPATVQEMDEARLVGTKPARRKKSRPLPIAFGDEATPQTGPALCVEADIMGLPTTPAGFPTTPAGGRDMEEASPCVCVSHDLWLCLSRFWDVSAWLRRSHLGLHTAGIYKCEQRANVHLSPGFGGLLLLLLFLFPQPSMTPIIGSPRFYNSTSPGIASSPLTPNPTNMATRRSQLL